SGKTSRFCSRSRTRFGSIIARMIAVAASARDHGARRSSERWKSKTATVQKRRKTHTPEKKYDCQLTPTIAAAASQLRQRWSPSKQIRRSGKIRYGTQRNWFRAPTSRKEK